MATRHGLCGWTDGRVRQAQAASGQLQAGIDGSRGAGGVAYEERGYKQAGQTDGQADGQANGPKRAKQRDVGSW